MYAVIFRATIADPDEHYIQMSERMRALALNQYGCIEFIAVSEGNQEIAISYWDNEEDIIAWKQDDEHVEAQRLGQTKWYSSYRVEVTEVKRSYSSTEKPGNANQTDNR